jgi:transcription elongation factor GreA
MSNQKFPMTAAGHARLRKMLDQLKAERPQISAAIEEARAHGDLKENAEYHAAKDKQGLVEAKIRELETKIARSQIIDPTSLSGSRVSFGATVTILDNDSDEETTYAIVGEDESDYKNGLLNFMSPIARGLMGKEEDDEVKIHVDNGVRSFTIMKVEFVAIQLSEPAH